MPKTRIDIESRFTLKVLVVLSKDHLGNTRVLMDEAGHVLQDNSYYPFGMAISSLSYDAGLHPENKFKYNGKELQDDFGLEWYDYGARFYDAEIGRWHSQDPLQQFHCPYNYAGNNPINNIDPSGMYAYNWYTGKYEDSDGNVVSWNEVQANNYEEPENKSSLPNFTGSLTDYFNVIGKAFRDLFFEKQELPNIGSIIKVRDEITTVSMAIEQGPVAVVISGNAAAQMGIGGADVSGGVVFILRGDDKGVYFIADAGAPLVSSGVSAGASAYIMPVFFGGNPEDFTVKNLEGTRLEVNTSIKGTPVVAGGFKSVGGKGSTTTFGMNLGVGKSAELKGMNLKQPFQVNIGTTTVFD